MKKTVIFVLVFFLFCNLCFVAATDNSAASAIVINARTRMVIYAKNAHEKRAMASTTKIMTALLLAECATPQKRVTVTREMVAVEGSSMGLGVGDIVTYNDLLYGILLPSGNDAANTAAISIGGSIEKFAELMNNRAAELGLKNTHFVTPSGLDADTHYTTAYDLAILASFALENDDFRKAASTKSIVLEYGGQKRYLANHNKMLRTYEGAIGVKTGFTSKAGRCLVSAAQKGDTEIIVVTLNDKNDWHDHANLLDYGFENSNEVSVIPTIPNFINCVGGDSDKINIVTTAAGIGVSGEEEFNFITHLPSFLYAPVKSGDEIGFTDVYCDGYKIATLPIFADSTVKSYDSENSFYNNVINLFLVMLRGL